MSTLGLGLVLLVIAVSVLPLWLLRGAVARHARDWLVAPERLRARTVRNASVATTMRAVVLVALFFAGARGGMWMAVAMAASLGGGIWLVYVLRRPLLQHLDGAVARDTSFSVLAFADQRWQLNAVVRRSAVILAFVVLAAIVSAEALTVRWVFEVSPVLRPSLSWGIAPALVATAAVVALASGHAAALQVAQFQLGLLQLGLLGSAVLLLYAQAAALAPVGADDSLMLVLGTAACVALMVKRRARYVDTDLIRPNAATPLTSQLFRRSGKVINQLVTTLAVLAIVIAGMVLYGVWSQGIAALPDRSGLPEWAIAAFCVVLLFYPLVDVALWQQLAALRVRAGPGELPDAEAEERIRSTFRAHAVQAFALGVIAAMLGSLAAPASGTRNAFVTPAGLASRLSSLDAELGGTLLPCLFLALVVSALTTMAAQFSAMLCTWRLDLQRDPTVGVSVGEEVEVRRRARVVVLVVALGIAVMSALVPLPSAAPQ